MKITVKSGTSEGEKKKFFPFFFSKLAKPGSADSGNLERLIHSSKDARMVANQDARYACGCFLPFN
jgi:hypothetical protein